LDIGVLGYIGLVQHKEHSPEVLSIPPGTPCIRNRCREPSATCFGSPWVLFSRMVNSSSSWRWQLYRECHRRIRHLESICYFPIRCRSLIIWHQLTRFKDASCCLLFSVCWYQSLGL